LSCHTPGAPGDLNLRAPRFNADLVAELVIRIITTQAYHGSRTSTATSTAAAPGPATLSSQSPPPKLAGTGRATAGNRLGKIQAAAAKTRTENSAPAPAIVSPAARQGPTAGGNAPQTPHALGEGAAPQTGEAILVFLSGVQAIDRVSQALRQRGVLQKLKAQVQYQYDHVLGSTCFLTYKSFTWKVCCVTSIFYWCNRCTY
jgi:hypothetical protein